LPKQTLTEYYKLPQMERDFRQYARHLEELMHPEYKSYENFAKAINEFIKANKPK